MLVLRRRAGEALVINGAVTVTVLAVEGERVKLGVIAPEQVVVLRGELIDVEAQQRHLRRKREELAKETDPRQQEKLEQSLARLEQSMRLMQPAIAPASAESQGWTQRSNPQPRRGVRSDERTDAGTDHCV